MLIFAISYLVHLVQQANLSRGALRLATGFIAFGVAIPLLSNLAFAEPTDLEYLRSTAVSLKSMSDKADVVLTDNPWIVAWYSDRNALWIPVTPKATNELRDNTQELKWVLLTRAAASYPLPWSHIYSQLVIWNQSWAVARASGQSTRKWTLSTRSLPSEALPFYQAMDGLMGVPPSGTDLYTAVGRLPDRNKKTRGGT
jgi:hypothetical protein